MKYVNEKLVFVDIETAGLECWRPIIQIAAVAVNSQLHILEEFDARIRFKHHDADPKSLRKNCYCPKLWRKRGLDKNVATAKFTQFLRRHATVDMIARNGNVYQVSQLIAHNANFDGPFLREWYISQGNYFPASPRVLCTLQKAMWLFEEQKSLTPPDNFKLQTLCQYFGVRLPKEQAHDAYFDVLATLNLYRAMNQVASAKRAA